MNKPRVVTLFSGGGGSDIGAAAAGCEIVHAVEYDAQIAEVYRRNIGDHVEVCKVEDADPTPWIGKADGLLASPVCKSFSRAKTGAVELQGDIDSAKAVARWIAALKPKFVVVENVAGYLKSRSFAIIANALDGIGYATDCSVLNSADFGVPQTRKRMILRAKREGRLHPLSATHAKTPGIGDLFGEAPKPWVGWYAAIEDLLPGLQYSQFAPWQLKRIDASLLKAMGIEVPFAVGGGNKSEAFLQFAVENRPTIPGIRTKDQPFMTVCSDAATNASARALLVESKFPGRNGRDGVIEVAGVPASTVTSVDPNFKVLFVEEEPLSTGADVASGGRAVLVGVQGENGELAREVDAPAPTITSAHSAEKYRAILVQGAASPSPTVTDGAASHGARAFLYGGTDATVRDGGEPAVTVTASHGNRTMARAVLIENLNLARKATVTGSGSPSPTVITATSGRRPANMPTAILCDGRSNDRGESMTVRDGEEPSMTIAASCDNRVLRASVGYRIVKMSPRCIARFQSVPDWYVLPEKTSLAGTIVGNMVPPLLMQRVVESVL